jgi:hypothetical protein
MAKKILKKFSQTNKNKKEILKTSSKMIGGKLRQRKSFSKKRKTKVSRNTKRLKKNMRGGSPYDKGKDTYIYRLHVNSDDESWELDIDADDTRELKYNKKFLQFLVKNFKPTNDDMYIIFLSGGKLNIELYPQQALERESSIADEYAEVSFKQIKAFFVENLEILKSIKPHFNFDSDEEYNRYFGPRVTKIPDINVEEVQEEVEVEDFPDYGGAASEAATREASTGDTFNKVTITVKGGGSSIYHFNTKILYGDPKTQDTLFHWLIRHYCIGDDNLPADPISGHYSNLIRSLTAQYRRREDTGFLFDDLSQFLNFMLCKYNYVYGEGNPREEKLGGRKKFCLNILQFVIKYRYIDSRNFNVGLPTYESGLDFTKVLNPFFIRINTIWKTEREGDYKRKLKGNMIHIQIIQILHEIYTKLNSYANDKQFFFETGRPRGIRLMIKMTQGTPDSNFKGDWFKLYQHMI